MQYAALTALAAKGVRQVPSDSERDSERTAAVIEVAQAIVGIGCKIAFGPVGALADPFTNVLARRTQKLMERRAANRMLEGCVDIVAKQIITSLAEEYRDLNDNEYIASVIAVKDTLERSLTNTKDIIRLDLNPAKLRRHVQTTSSEILGNAALSDAATEFYKRVLADSCAYLVQFVMTLPENTPNVLQELLQRQGSTLQKLTDMLERIPKSRRIDDFEADYRQALINKLDRMELFGINIDEASSNYPLSVAYVSLQVLRRQQRPNLPQPPTRPKLSTGSRVEEVLSTLDRVFVEGDAGSGKTTLLRYLAVSR
jgi:predicted NACHT family NTPase